MNDVNAIVYKSSDSMLKNDEVHLQLEYLISLLADCFKTVDSIVAYVKYWKHHYLLVETPWDYFVVDILVSFNNSRISPANFEKRYLRHQENMLAKVLSEHAPPYKKCSGIFRVFVVNTSPKNANFTTDHVKVNDKRVTMATAIISRDPKDDDYLWLGEITERLRKWISGRLHGIANKCREEGRDPKEDKMFKFFLSILDNLQSFVKNLRRYLEAWNEEHPATIASAVGVAGILRTCGIQSDLNTIKFVHSIITKDLNIPKPKDLGLVLERLCDTKIRSGIKEYKPTRTQKKRCLRIVDAFQEKPAWFTQPKVKPIKVFREDDFTDDVEAALPLLVAHEFTVHGVILNKTETLYAVCSGLLNMFDVKHDPNALETVVFDYLRRTTVLLTKRAYLKAWKRVYYTFCKRRR